MSKAARRVEKYSNGLYKECRQPCVFQIPLTQRAKRILPNHFQKNEWNITSFLLMILYWQASVDNLLTRYFPKVTQKYSTG